VPRPLTTAVRYTRARGPHHCAPAAVGDQAPFATAVGGALGRVAPGRLAAAVLVAPFAPPRAVHLVELPWAAFLPQPSSLQRSPPPCEKHNVALPSADLPHPSNTYRLPPPWAMHRREVPRLALVQPSSLQRSPPPCAKRLPEKSHAALAQPSSSQRLPPPCEMHLPDEPFAPLGQPG